MKEGEGKEKEERDTRRKCFGKFRFAADIDTKFLSNRRDLLYMNDNQWRSAACRNLISENVLRRWMRTTTASLDDSWKLAVYLPFFRTVHGIWKPFHERKGIRNVLFPTCLSHVQAGRYIWPALWWLEWVVNLDDCSLVLHLPSTRNFTLKRWPTSEKFWEIFSYLTTFSL